VRVIERPALRAIRVGGKTAASSLVAGLGGSPHWLFHQENSLSRSAHMNRPSIVTLLFIVISVPFVRGDAESDARQMEGTWKPRSAEFAGDGYPKKILDTMKLVLKGETYLVDVGGQLDEGKCKRDPA
jgi:hypothetical protein